MVFADQRAGGSGRGHDRLVVLLVLVDRGRISNYSNLPECKSKRGNKRPRPQLQDGFWWPASRASPSGGWYGAAIRKPEAARHLLVRLSGRQMKHGRLFTVPALLAGLWALLEMLEALNEYTLQDLRTLTDVVLAHLPPQSP